MPTQTARNRPIARRRDAALITVALAAAFLPLPGPAVERLYSARAYAALQVRMTTLSNQVPFALLDVLIAVAVIVWLGLAARDFVKLHSPGRAVFLAIARTIVWSAVAYLAFLVLWGFNYRRVRLVETLPFDAARVTPEAVAKVATIAVDRVNALYDPARAEGWLASAAVDPALAGALDRALADIGRAHHVVPGRPKATLLDAYFRRAGVDGMTDPFFLETLVASNLLPFELPFVLAHEWGHLAGIADEGEANFVGWLACTRASPAAQYSGWLFLYGELVRAVPERERQPVAARLAPGPRADLRAIRERFLRHVNPRVSAAGWRVYDSYLKANRVEAGAASYAEVVRLVVGTRLPSGWEPLQ
jgi:uncharacterized protein DUF3810